MSPEERILVEDLLLEYKSLVDYLRNPPGGIPYNTDYNEVTRREAEIDGIRQSLSSILKCSITH